MNKYFLDKSDKTIFPCEDVKDVKDKDRKETFYIEKFLFAEDEGVNGIIKLGKKIHLIGENGYYFCKTNDYKDITEMAIVLRGLKDLAHKNRNTIFESVYADMLNFVVSSAINFLDYDKYRYFEDVFKGSKKSIFGCDEQ